MRKYKRISSRHNVMFYAMIKVLKGKKNGKWDRNFHMHIECKYPDKLLQYGNVCEYFELEMWMYPKVTLHWLA